MVVCGSASARGPRGGVRALLGVLVEERRTPPGSDQARLDVGVQRRRVVHGAVGTADAADAELGLAALLGVAARV